MKQIGVFKLDREQLSLLVLSLIGITIHLVWVTVDQSLPAWDQAAHLTSALNFQKVINQIQIFSPTWWHELWAQATSYRAPLIYVLTVPFLNIFGKSLNAGLLVNLLFIPIIICSTYYLGKRAFDERVGLWAAGLCIISPALLAFQLDYLLDYGIVGLTTLNFLVLSLWKDATTKRESWRWSLIFGILFGCLMLTKPTGFIFLSIPGIYLLSSLIRQRNWLKLLQAGLVLIIAWAIFGSWFSQNWLTIITSAIAANGMGKGEGDPPGNTLEGWLYYIRLLPELVSVPILITAIGFAILWLFRRPKYASTIQSRQVLWLLIYFIGIYSFCSLATNKDGRFISPILPILSIFLAYVLNLFQTSWLRRLRWFAVGLNGLLLLIHILPIPGTDSLLRISQVGYSYSLMAQVKPELSSQQLIKEITTNQPYLRSNIGSMVSSREINFENLDFYGQAANFQVYAREFSGSGNQAQQLIDRDLKAFNWYTLKTGDIGKIDQKLLPIVESDRNLQLHKSWQTREGSILKLYRRKNIPILVEPIVEDLKNVRLDQVTISPALGLSIDTTYQLSGDRESLKNGILLLSWHSKDLSWNHDHGIGMGELYLDRSNYNKFQITEHSAMLPPAASPLEGYQLTATYLDRKTGATYPLAVPKIEVQAKAEHPAELDLITRLHQLGKLFAQGKIDPVFSEIAILNQYDPIQDYLTQAQQAIQYRIDRGDHNLDLKYTLALTQALQRQIEPLLTNLTQITKQDPQNPSGWTYLGVVRLYNWQPQAAEMVFKKAEKLPSPPSALSTLKIVSALFRFDLPQVWQRLQAVSK
jgi:4-amino-4-deoxy-L-arabinose transferase-like glycosyltransferase